MAIVTLRHISKWLCLATALFLANAARPADDKSNATPRAGAPSVSATAVHMATATALLQAHLASNPSHRRVASPGSGDPGDSVSGVGSDIDLDELMDHDGPGSKSGVGLDSKLDSVWEDDDPADVRLGGQSSDEDHFDMRNFDQEPAPVMHMAEEHPRDGPVHIPPVIIGDSQVPLPEDVAAKDLFKRTADESKNLQEAARGIDSTIHRVDQAIQKVYGATDKYHKSVNSLTGQFGKLHNMATDVHSEVLTEFKDRESDRMCAFENVERMLRGETFQPCNSASAPANGDYRSNFAQEQPRDEKLSPSQDGEVKSQSQSQSQSVTPGSDNDQAPPSL